MAGDWISIEHATPDKPEVFCIAEQLGIDPDEVVGKLIRLWVWADTQTYNGDADALVSRLLIDRKAGLKGFADAMEVAGWLHESEDGRLSFPNFGDHNGETAKTRKQNAKRQAKYRQQKDGENGVSRKQRDTIVTPSVTTEQNRTGQNKTLPPKQPGKVSSGSSPSEPSKDNLGGWDLISDQLRDSGVRAFRASVSDAQANGWTVKHAEAVLEFWASTDDLGAFELRERFKAQRSLAPADGWPSLAAKKKSAGKRDKLVEASQAEARRREAARRLAEQQLAEDRANGRVSLRRKPRPERQVSR